MATAKKVEITPIAPPPPFNVELTLSQEEATSLRTVCAAIGGGSVRRKHTEQIYNLLGELGVETKPLELSILYQELKFV